MDSKLVAWARSVKARRPAGTPLWLFADPQRLPDPCAAAARLPRGLCGVVLRADPGPGRLALGQRLRRICRERRLALSVAADWRVPGDWRLAAALGGAMHLRGGRRPVAPRWCRAATGSAHGAVELVRANRAKVALVFLSPAFATPSHPGRLALGPVQWSRLANRATGVVAALGGVEGRKALALSRRCGGAGAIGALAGRGCGV